MLISIISVFLIHLILPGYFIYSLWRGQKGSKFKWLVQALYSSAFLLYIFLIGNWAWLSYYLRYAWLALLVVVLAISYRRIRHAPFYIHGSRSEWRSTGVELFILLVFVAFLLLTVRGYFYADEPVHLAFPLDEGWYYVGQGGNSSLLNYHNTNRTQQYALDILALNAAGLRALGIYPSDVNRYVIWGERVNSPCDGTVLEAVDGLPDHAPPETDREHLAGNHVVITCQGVNVVLAHLQNGSVAVQAGDAVTTGQPLGKVGNSGNTTEPHLHIHAIPTGSADMLEGDGVPMLFEGKFAVRNTVFVK